MYPIKFAPIYKNRIWGGSNLSAVFGRKLDNEKVGESWEISSHPHGVSIVTNGHLAGKSLNEVIEEYKEEIIGRNYIAGKPFPLLIKIIDANDKLSIQVHPDDDYSYRVEGEAGKTEAWYVVDAKPDAKIAYGLQEGIDKVKFIEAVQEGKIQDAIKMVPVKAGDLIFVPAGTVHALLDGVMVYEVQQNSDTTYRVYDYDRVDDTGNKRELHLNKAVEVINFVEQPACDFSRKIECPYFSMEKLAISGEKTETIKDQFIIYCVTGGTGEIRYQHGTESLKSGDTVLIPATLGNVALKGNLDVIKIT